EVWTLNLKVGNRFRSVPLKDLRDFGLENPKLEEELDKALAAVASSRDQEKKPVTIQFRGNGERRVRMGYVVETPIWKTSYRLVLSDVKKEDAKAGAELKAPAAAKPSGPALELAAQVMKLRAAV